MAIELETRPVVEGIKLICDITPSDVLTVEFAGTRSVFISHSRLPTTCGVSLSKADVKKLVAALAEWVDANE